MHGHAINSYFLTNTLNTSGLSMKAADLADIVHGPAGNTIPSSLRHFRSIYFSESYYLKLLVCHLAVNVTISVSVENKVSLQPVALHWHINLLVSFDGAMAGIIEDE